MSASRGPNLVPQLFQRQSDSNINKFRSNLFRERFRIARNLYKYDLVSHYGCVNAIEFSNGGEFLISGGDDKRVLLWNIEKAIAKKSQPVAMEKEHQSNIFCLSFNNNNSKIFSGGNDDVVIVHDVATGSVSDVFLHAKPVYGLSVDSTNDNILATAGEDGHVLLFDQRSSAVMMSLGKYRGPFHAVQFHPQDGNFLVTANSKKGAAFWDIRKPQNPLIQYGGEENPQSCMSIRFNSHGSQVLVLRRRLPPILYNTFSQEPICQFYHPDYYNSCTMKSCCFAGEDDEFVLSGSDDFNLYVWRVGDVHPDITNQWIEQTQMVLYGHRSIVNQVRYNPPKCLLASSGVEKIVKLWSPFEQKDWTGNLTEEATGPENPREVFTHDAYYSLIHLNWNDMTHDYSNQNTREDPRMMAFFDSLIQQEIEGWNSNNSSETDEWSNRSSENSTRQSSTESSDEVNYFVNTRDRHRRGLKLNTMKPQRNKYANRIAYLIATKRNTLRRLALKGASQSNRRRQSTLKGTKRKAHSHRSVPRTTRSGTGLKRMGRFTLPTRHKAQHSHFRSARRKSSRNNRSLDRFESSSDDDVSPARDEDGMANANSNGGTSSSSAIAVPSTSTGITSNGKDIIYCLRQQQVDSDDDNTPVNSDNEPERPSLQSRDGPKTPINGFHGNNKPAIANTAATNHTNVETPPRNHVSSDVDEDRYSNSPNVRRRHHTNTIADYDVYSSHSNSRLSNSSCLDRDDSSTDESLNCYMKKRKIVPNNNNNNSKNNNSGANGTRSQDNATTAAIGLDINEVKTPNNSSNCKITASFNYTPDSGISNNAAGCSSSGSVASQTTNSNNNHSSSNINHNNNNNSLSTNNDKFSLKLFHQKVARVRRNYRNKFGDDSESD